MIHGAEKGIELALVEAVGHSVVHTGVEITAHGMALGAGGALHAVVATGMASHATHKARGKEKTYESSGGLKGFSRTRANKEVTKTWTGAAAGTGAAVGMGIGGAMVGQVGFHKNYLTKVV